MAFVRFEVQMLPDDLNSPSRRPAACPNPRLLRRPRDDEPPTLLNLPGELRNMILSELLTSEEAISIFSMRPIPPLDPRIKAMLGYASRNATHIRISNHDDIRLALEPAVAAVCRSLRQEALSIWYTDNVFFIDIDDRAPTRHFRMLMDAFAHRLSKSPSRTMICEHLRRLELRFKLEWVPKLFLTDATASFSIQRSFTTDRIRSTRTGALGALCRCPLDSTLPVMKIFRTGSHLGENWVLMYAEMLEAWIVLHLQGIADADKWISWTRCETCKLLRLKDLDHCPREMFYKMFTIDEEQRNRVDLEAGDERMRG